MPDRVEAGNGIALGLALAIAVAAWADLCRARGWPRWWVPAGVAVAVGVFAVVAAVWLAGG